MNFYNDTCPTSAATIRQLIADGIIPDGVVDERSITEIQPADLAGFTQCHFFAGVSGWSIALRLSGWDAARPVWTGSCPCQPFSVAGKGKGTDDERHLWPDFFRLIDACKPPVAFGEQVASKDGREWLAGIRADLEGVGYEVGAADLCAPGVAAPHLRQRLYWVAQSESQQYDGSGDARSGRGESSDGGSPDRLADSLGTGLEGHGRDGDDGNKPGRVGAVAAGPTPARCPACGVGHATVQQRGWPWEYRTINRWSSQVGGSSPRSSRMGIPHGTGREQGQPAAAPPGHGDSAEPASNLWADSVFIPCRDGKARRVPTESVLQLVADGLPESSLSFYSDGFAADEIAAIGRASSGFPLAQGVPHRAQILKLAGNAIIPALAAEFIQAFLETEETR